MLVNTSDREIVGDMPGEAVDMSLSSDSLEHIMDILSDLYSNRPAAIVREYSTNALDSHIISGQTKPIEIRTPSRLNPNLIIQDFGKGMTKQQLIDTYSKYGASTKRNNNLEAGQLGLGSKSGFAYTDQFTVRSISNGHCCEIIMSRNDRGAAEMNIAFDYATEDESGVTITIPIKTQDISDVQREAENFAEYATPGTVKVNGVVNAPPESWTKIADSLYMEEHSIRYGFGASSDVIVMGNVAYPVGLRSSDRNYYSSTRAIFYVPMGAVDFVPSREALKNTAHTTRYIASLKKQIAIELNQYIRNIIDSESSRRDKIIAALRAQDWVNFGIDKSVVNGENLLKDTSHFSVQLPRDITDSNDKLIRHNSADSKYLINPRDIGVLKSDSFFAVTDFPGGKFSRDQAKKLLTAKPEWAGAFRVRLFESSKDQLDDLFDNWQTVSWNDIKSTKVTKSKVTKPVEKKDNKRRGRLVHKQREGIDSVLTTDGPAYYVSHTDWQSIPSKYYPREDFKLFFVAKSAQKSFVNKNPHAKSLVDYADNKKRQIINHVQKNSHVRDAVLFAGRSVPGSLDKIDPSEIRNETFKKNLFKAKTGNKWFRLLPNRLSDSTSTFEDYLELYYPLIYHRYCYSYRGVNAELTKKHTIQYINMIGEENDNA